MPSRGLYWILINIWMISKTRVIGIQQFIKSDIVFSQTWTWRLSVTNRIEVGQDHAIKMDTFGRQNITRWSQMTITRNRLSKLIQNIRQDFDYYHLRMIYLVNQEINQMIGLFRILRKLFQVHSCPKSTKYSLQAYSTPSKSVIEPALISRIQSLLIIPIV